MKTLIIKPIGYCNGLNKAFKLVDEISLKTNKNIKIYGSLAHNEVTINKLEKKNIQSINNFDDLNENDMVIFSAHSHLKEKEIELNKKKIEYYDATCFNVAKNMTLIDYYHNIKPIIFIGKRNHEETTTALSYSNVILYDINNGIDETLLTNNSYIVISQTSISLNDFNKAVNYLRNKINDLTIVDGICGLIKQRLENLKKIDNNSNVILIIGSKTSSNTNTLFNEAKRLYPNKNIYMINGVDEINFKLNKDDIVTIISGCSADNETINQIIEYLNNI